MKKEGLTEDNRAELVAYRIERANQSMVEAKFNGDSGFYNIAVNRLYYAAYYITSALLLQHGLSGTTHAGVKSMLGKFFVKTGKLPVEIGSIFTTLFNSRQTGDYEDFFYCNEEYYTRLLPQAELYLSTIKKLIQSSDSTATHFQ